MISKMQSLICGCYILLSSCDFVSLSVLEEKMPSLFALLERIRSLASAQDALVALKAYGQQILRLGTQFSAKLQGQRQSGFLLLASRLVIQPSDVEKLSYVVI